MTQQALLALLLTLARILPGPLDAQEVHQSPRVVIASEGDSINITCSTRGDLDGILMKRIWPQDYEVIYFEDGEEPTVDKTFSDRIDFSGSQKNLTITMRLLQLSDTGAYTCEAVRKVSARGLFTTVVVREKLSQEAYRSPEPLQISVSLPAVIAVGFFLIGLLVGVLCSMLLKTQIKKLCASGSKDSPCVVYEDMSYSVRKTPCVPNQYQ
ncbi:T-cell antigen CD7 [Arvicanthis niloticus]|uniref:T-cell antigen CD7 n=1 Tax=Arvicanthis niloticus TaxID=61156 RepID=UPI0014872E6A|nr:T-cell antigen CD7 [Arvicanthis niloticus]